MPSLLDDPPRARSACVVVGATPDAIRSLGDAEADANARYTVRANRLGVLIFGRLGGLPVDFAEAFDGPVYDILYNPSTGWFAVTIFRGVEASPVRYDNRPGAEAGYPRVDDVLGHTSPPEILAALDVPADVLGYVTS
jgi:hypothetical protein